MKKRPMTNRASTTLALGLEATRKNASLSRFDLAMRADCSPQQILRIEERQTNPSQALIAKLAVKLGKTPADIYMAGELRLEEETVTVARERRELVERQRDLNSVLEAMRHLDPEDLETIAATATQLSN